jgi:hypothetical protein
MFTILAVYVTFAIFITKAKIYHFSPFRHDAEDSEKGAKISSIFATFSPFSSWRKSKIFLIIVP